MTKGRETHMDDEKNETKETVEALDSPAKAYAMFWLMDHSTFNHISASLCIANDFMLSNASSATTKVELEVLEKANKALIGARDILIKGAVDDIVARSAVMGIECDRDEVDEFVTKLLISHGNDVCATLVDCVVKSGYLDDMDLGECDGCE